MFREQIGNGCFPRPRLGLEDISEPVILSEKYDGVRQAYIFCTGSGDPVEEILKGKWGKWGKLDGRHKVIESGHWPMITKPAELAKAMLDLA